MRVFRTDASARKVFVPKPARFDSKSRPTWTRASDTRTTHIMRHDEGEKRKTYVSAEAARNAMIERRMKETQDTQEGMRDVMTSAASERYVREFKGLPQRQTAGQQAAHDWGSVFGNGGVSKPEKERRSAEEARAAMIDRMTGACPDRIPKGKI